MNKKLRSAPNGAAVFSANGLPTFSADFGPFTLDQNGIYTLTVDPTQDNTPDYQFQFWVVDPFDIGGETISFGAAVSDTFAIPGQVAVYSFDATAGQTVFFDLITMSEASNGFTDFRLLDPAGNELASDFGTPLSPGIADFGPVQLPQAGTYELIVDPRGDAVPSFEFKVDL